MDAGYPRTESDVFHVTFILRQVTIRDLIPDILDLAEYWVRKILVVKDEPMSVTESSAGRLYVVAHIPLGFPPQSLRKIIFTVTSRDQGWSWDSRWHGTYEQSWTWFNAIVFEPDAYELANIVAEKERLFINRHAHRDWETKTVVWWSDTTEELEHRLMKEIRGGRHLGITVSARYAAWRNDVRSAHLAIYAADVHRG